MPFASGEKALLTENGQSNRKGKEFPAANWRESQASDKFKEGLEGKSRLPIAFGFVRFNEQQFCLREFTVGAYDASGFVALPRAIVPIGRTLSGPVTNPQSQLPAIPQRFQKVWSVETALAPTPSDRVIFMFFRTRLGPNQNDAQPWQHLNKLNPIAVLAVGRQCLSGRFHDRLSRSVFFVSILCVASSVSTAFEES